MIKSSRFSEAQIFCQDSVFAGGLVISSDSVVATVGILDVLSFLLSVKSDIFFGDYIRDPKPSAYRMAFF